MTATSTQPQYETVGFTYTPPFPLEFLRADEIVAQTGNGSGHCVISSPRGHVRLQPGDLITRRQDGSLFTTSPNGHPRGGASDLSRGVAADAPSEGCEHCSCVTEEGAACCHCEFVPAAGAHTQSLRSAPQGSVV
jgi:hypothetical protein